MGRLGAAGVSVLACVVSACGTDPGASSAQSSTTPTQKVSRTAKSPEQPTKKDPAPSVREDPPVLFGMVGAPDDAEAFTIALVDSSGKPVTRLEAGAYRVKVTDPASYHNFHLTGPGVDQRTSIFGTGEVTWDLVLRSGTYTFVCDPHPQMAGDVSVAGGGN